jgi:ABC-type sugar transport system ATPase subunit
MAAITLENVGKRNGSVVTVSGPNLYISGGEFMVLVGSSSCGKSTTLRVITSPALAFFIPV